MTVTTPKSPGWPWREAGQDDHNAHHRRSEQGQTQSHHGAGQVGSVYDDLTDNQEGTREHLPWTNPRLRSRFFRVLAMEVCDQTRIQDVTRRNPTLLLGAVSLPVHQILELHVSRNPAADRQQNGCPIYLRQDGWRDVRRNLVQRP